MFRHFIAALITTATIATLAVATPAQAAQAADEPASQRVVPEFTVFVDPPTGFVFVKLPQGWKFAGKVDAIELTRLPAGVVTALLKDESSQTLAQRDTANRAQ